MIDYCMLLCTIIAQFLSGFFKEAGSVGTKPKQAYFESLNTQFQKPYLYMCCKKRWNSVSLDVSGQGSTTPPKRRPPPHTRIAKCITHCVQYLKTKEGGFIRLKLTPLVVQHAILFRQLFGKPICNEPIFACKSSYIHTNGVRTSLDNFAKRIDGPSQLTCSESDIFVNCVFECEGVPDRIATLSYEE